LRIVHLIDYFQPLMGYQETFLAREQLRQGHTVTVVTSDRYAPLPNYASTVEPLLGPRLHGAGDFQEEGISVKRLPVWLERSNRCWLKGLAPVMRELRPDVVHAHNVVKFTTLQIAHLKRKLKCGLLVDDHQHPVDLNQSAKGELFFRGFRACVMPYLRQRVDALVGVTEEIAEVVRHTYGFDRPPVEVIELGVDCDLFQRLPEARTAIRKELGVSDATLLAIYTGKIIPAKGVQWLIQAICHSPPEVACLLLGNGPAEYVSELRQLAMSDGARGRVHFVPAVKQADLPRYYSAADVACWPKGVSIATLEAAACELPLVIAANTVPERVAHENGREYPEGSVEDLAKILTELSARRSATEMMGRRSRQMVAEQHSWKKINQRFVEIYERIRKV
jgi:glycosyltransferase involved in cell wall biosynthesis